MIGWQSGVTQQCSKKIIVPVETRPEVEIVSFILHQIFCRKYESHPITAPSKSSMMQTQ